MKESFVFYASFYQALNQLDNDKDKLTLFMAISEYALTGKEPDLTGVIKGYFILIKPLLDANNQRYENSRKGGRPRRNTSPQDTPFPDETPQENTPQAAETEVSEADDISEITFGYDEDAKLHGVDDNSFTRWQKHFPALDISQELRNAEAWLDSHRKQRKRNIKKFLTDWMIRSQQRLNNAPPGPGSYDKLDGNTPAYVSKEDRRAFDGF